MQNKALLTNLRTDYFKSCTRVFRMGLHSYSILIYCYLSSCSENFDPSVRIIAKKLKIGRNSVTKGIAELQEANMIRLIQAGEIGRSAEYSFIDPTLWRPIRREEE